MDKNTEFVLCYRLVKNIADVDNPGEFIARAGEKVLAALDPDENGWAVQTEDGRVCFYVEPDEIEEY